MTKPPTYSKLLGASADERRTLAQMRSLPSFYKLAHELTKNDDYLAMTESQFVDRGMRLANGKASPKSLKALYFELMQDAGLPPLLNPRSPQADH